MDEPIRTINWISDAKDMAHYTNPTINCARFAPISSQPYVPSTEYIIAGCYDGLRNQPVKCFDMRTGAIVHQFKFVQTSCLSLDVSADGKFCVMGDITGVFHFDDINYNEE